MANLAIQATTATPASRELDRSLRELPIVVIDVQTTGATPERGAILDAAWARTSACERTDDAVVRHTLVAQPAGITIPRQIARLTGLSDDDLADAVTPAELWARLSSDILDGVRAGGVPIAHCASFEDRFLRALHASQRPASPYPIDFLCTLEIARRLFPDLPRRGLRALAGYFGLVMPELKRASAQVLATMRVWSSLVTRLDEDASVRTLDDLHRFLGRRPPRRGGTWAVPLARDRRLSLPDAPGVYRLCASGGEVLYVGKACSLKTRVNSYYRKRRMEEKLLELISQVHDVRITETRTALEAAIVEAAEIKRLAPPYNRALRERGQSLWYYSRDLTRAVRGTEAALDSHRIGPFPSREFVDALATIGRCLQWETPRVDDVRSTLAALNLTHARVAADTLLDGLARFAVTYALRPELSDPGHLFQLGTRLWRERMATARDEQPEDSDTADESGHDRDVLDADGVARHLEGVIISCARHRRRARVLRLLASSTLRWWQGANEHELSVRDGEFSWRGAGVDATRSSTAFRIRDRATYDRLRVLMTEIRRLVRERREVILRFRGGPEIRSDAIARMLADV